MRKTGERKTGNKPERNNPERTVFGTLLALIAAALLFTAGCSATPSETAPGTVPAAGAPAGGEQAGAGSGGAGGGGAAPAGETKSFDMTAKQWEFIPDTITVNRGDHVVLNIRSIDVAHGIGLPDFGVNSYLEPGTTTRVEFDADRSGTFSFFCSVQCGAGHSSMRGTLIVQE